MLRIDKEYKWNMIYIEQMISQEQKGENFENRCRIYINIQR